MLGSVEQVLVEMLWGPNVSVRPLYDTGQPNFALSRVLQKLY